MKVTQITVERSYTINLGNYETARFGGSVTGEVTDDDDPDVAYNDLVGFLEGKLAEDMAAFSEE